MKRLNLRELEILNSLYLRFTEYKKIEELGILQFRTALAEETKTLQRNVIKCNQDFKFIFKNEVK